MKLREVNARLLNKNMITDIQKKLSEYPRYIMSIVDFSFAAQRIIEKHMQSIAKLSSQCLQQQSSCQRQQQQQKDNSQLQLEQITGIYQQNGQTLELQRDSVGFMGVLLGSAEKMFNDKERVFSNASQGAVQELGSVIQDVEQTQSSLQLAGLSEYREEERSFFNQLNLFKECCSQTTKKIDSYKNALIDPSLIYNTKQQLLKWNQLASQYSSLLQMQIGISDYLELFQTKRKALAINLQELLEQNKLALIKVITLFQRFTQTSAPQFIHLFFFFATYLHDHTKSLRATKEKSRIRQSQTFESMSFTAEPQQFLRYLEAQTKINDQQLIGFSDISALFIAAIQKQSLQRQEEINRSLKYLENLKSCYDISAKNLKELLTEFESKNKHAIIRLMGKESAAQLNNLLNSVQIVSSEFYRQSKIIQVASQQISYHLQTLQNCHNQVFTGLNRSLSDHSNIKNEFKKSLENFQSQVLIQNERARMQQSVPLLKECFVYILQDYQRINQKELNGVRDCQWNIILQLEQSCRDLISHSEKITENDHIHGLEDIPNSPIRFNSSENVNTKLIESVVQNTLETDKVLSVLYVDLKEEIAGLGKDFEKTEFFDYQLVEQLTPPQGMQPLVGPSIREQQRKRQKSLESFVSFEVVSDNEEEKISARQYERRLSTSSEEYFYAEKHSKGKNQGESTEQQHQSSSQRGTQAQQNHPLHHVSSPSLHHHLSVQESQTKKEELIQHEKFIRQRTIWSEGEELKHHFSCAFAQRINLQGRIYITNLRLIFHSYFNGNTIFFNETLLEIPKSDIRIIHKRKNMLFLDNAIQIDVIKGSLLFTQFIYRDAAFDAIVKVLQPSEMAQISNAMQSSQMRKRTLVEIDEDLNLMDNNSIRIDNDNEDESDSEDCTEQEIQQQIAQRRDNIENGMKQNDSFKHTLIQTVLKGENISIKDLFQSCLSDNTYAHQGEGQQKQQSQSGSSNTSQSQIYQNYFFYYIKNVMKCWDISIENWSPPPPAYFLKSSGKDVQKEKQEEKVQKWLEISQRQINYNKGIPFSGIPFIPKSCHVQEKQKLYFISVDSLVFELEIYSSGVPMADTFYLIIRNSFSQINPDQISYKVEMDVRILKSTWLSATLESQCIKEGTTSSNLIASYFQERITEFMAANKKLVLERKSQTQDGNNILRSSTNLHESGEKNNNNNQQHKYNLQSPPQDSQQQKQQSKQNNSRNNRNQQTQQLSKEREARILKTLDPIELYTTKLFEMQLGDSKVEITPFDAFLCLFGETTTLCKGYSDPYQCLKVEKFKDTKYQITKWDPPLIDIFSQNKHNDSSSDSSKREVQFVHPLPSSSIPFMPKECSVKEIQTCYQLSDKLIIMNSEVFTTGVPKGDSFTARLRMIFEQISPNVIRYSQHSYMNFIKSTFLQGAIEKASIEQQQIAAGVIQQFTGDLINTMIVQKRQQLSQHVAPETSNILKRLSSSDAVGNPKCLQEMEHRKRRILSLMEPNDKFTQKVIEKSFSTTSTTASNDVSLQEFIHLMFSESLPFEGSSDFIEYIKVIKSADKDFTSTRYNPTFPAYFSFHKTSPTEDNLQALLKSVDMSERQITYTHPMPPTSIPFMPKTCKIKEIHKIYFISPELVVVNIEVFTSGVPKCDTFSVRMRQIFRQVHSEHRIEFTLLAYVQFFENTILAGKIQSSAIEQQTLSAQTITVPNYENAMNLLRNRRQSKESPMIKPPSHTKNQYSLHRVKSIHLADEGEERISLADCSPNYQPQGNSNMFQFSEQQRSNVQQRRSSITKNKQKNTSVGGVDRTFSQQDQVVKLTENIESMNSKFKLFMIGFVVIYVTTLLGFFLKS